MTPRLTVVVPVYNVEQYLEECLRSIAAQTFTDLDVVMVDDGSTDAGPDLAQAFADRDPRFRLVRQPNGGLGHARNTGARNADPGTSYLTFVDSDDVLPPRAYEKLVGLLDRSGSDFATGNVYRLTTQGRSQAWQHRGMDRTVERTHITRDLGLLSDRVAWNKVFRRTFWDKHALAFPEGVLYEDTPLTIPAHFLAEAVDVSHEHVYYWRIREGSITRRRTDVKGVRDRIAAVDGVSRFLAEPANSRWSAYKRDYDRSVLTDDLLYFIEALPMAGPEYHQVFLARVSDYLSRVDPTLFPALPVELRIRWELIRQGRLDDLLEVLAHEQRGGRTVFDIAGPPLRKRAVIVRGDGTPVPLPRAVTAVTTKDLPVTARLSELEWRDGRLILKGHAYVRNLDARSRRTSLKTAVLMSGRRKLLLPVRTVRADEVTAADRQERHSYDWSGFEITVDPKRLRANGGWRAGQWRLGIVVAAGAVVRPAAPRADDAGAGSSPVPFPLDDDTRLVPWYKDGRLHLSVEPITRRLTGHRPGPDNTVTFDLAVRDRKAPVAVRVKQQTTGAAFDYPLRAAEAGGPAVAGAVEAGGTLGNGAPDGLVEAGGTPGNGGPDTAAAASGGTAPARLAEAGAPGSDRTPGSGPADAGAAGTGTTGSGGTVPDGWTVLTASVVLADLAGARPAVDGLPKEVAPETAAAWAVEVVFADGGTARVAVDRPLPHGRYDLGADERLAGARRELVVDATAAGNLLLRDRTPQPLATHVTRATNGTLLITGELPADTPPQARLVLRHGQYATEVGVEVTAELPTTGAGREAGTSAGGATDGPAAAGALSAAGMSARPAAAGAATGPAGHDGLEPAARQGGAADGAAQLPSAARRFSAALDVSALPHAGRWYLHLRSTAERSDPVRIARDALHTLPLELPAAAGVRPLTVNRRFHDHLFVEAGSPVPAADRGPYRQRMLRERRYPVLLRRPLTDTVLYSSFDGRDCADSPRAVHDELVRRGVPFDHVWVVRDHTTAVPATARSVLHGSDAWYEALARCRHVVTNTHLPAWFRRREGQQVVQTWHGAPVKRIGQDLAGTLCADLTHMWPQPRLGHQWSVLLSPNSQSTPALRRALGYDGEVAETGLPRTDLLSGEDRDKIREEVRARLGLPPGRTVVLYAPTVRDDEAYDAEHARLHLPADLSAMAAALSGSHVLLVRAHPLVADTVPAQMPGGNGTGFVRDVSAHPDLAELLLAADVLVTDYSSVLADFAVTGRPVLLLTPDLAHYRDTLRGFTFDFEAQAPGPLLRTTDELIAALRDPEAAVRGRADAYAAFRAAFCHLDDGGAAARVADLMLG